MIPTQISYRDISPSDSISADIRSRVDKLEQFYDRIDSCRVVVSAPHRHHQKGTVYHVMVRVHVPGSVIVAAREPERNGAHEDVYVVLRDAFDEVRRRLEDYVRKIRMRGDIHEEPPHGVVVRLFAAEGYGFISTLDGREVYFHQNSVLNNEFKNLEVGTEVRFSEEMGDNGWQVTSMSPVGKSGKHQFFGQLRPQELPAD